ncbi:MAG: DUF3488 and transglutaminase-like domain-containing protein [Candidatus Sumerlaeia bacterium]|nr:DUF3488 and transglutaminase-like domain-containing protein [Candidatus Sumerlaeia bacterium]
MTFLFRFRLLTYLTSLWAFLALVMTGQLHALAIVGFLVFWALAVLRDPELWRGAQDTGFGQVHASLRGELPRWMWTLISLFAFGAAFYGWQFLGERMYAVTYFFFYLELNKLLTARSNRDVLQIYALTFFHILAASVSTESFLFAPMLVVYLFLILQALMTFTIKRDVESALKEGAAPVGGLNLQNFSNATPYRLGESDALALQRVAGEKINLGRASLLVQRNYALLSLGVVLLGMCTFWIVPRTATQNFFNPGLVNSSNAQRISGYADEISFGGLGEIQKNPAIVMRAEPLPEFLQNRPEFLRIRGTALDRFTGREWSKSDFLITNSQMLSNIQEISFKGWSLDPRFERPFDAKIILEPIANNYIFMVDQPLKIYLNAPTTVMRDGNAWSLRIAQERYETDSYLSKSNLFLRERYLELLDQGNFQQPELETDDDGFLEFDANTPMVEKISLIAQRIQERRPNITLQQAAMRAARYLEQREADRSAELEQRENYRRNFLQLPASLNAEELLSIAEEFTQGASTKWDKAVALENHFKNNFTYTLDVSFSNREDHIMHFLRESKSGHCEYFATGMVLLLRSMDIPARIVNGYLTDEWVESQKRYIVRQEHAHSWVEVQLGEDNRWITFDPTPESGIGSNRISISWYHRFSSYFDGVRMWWYNNVVDYNVEDQKQGFLWALRGLGQLSNNSGQTFQNIQNLFGAGTGASAGQLARTLLWGMALILLLAGLLLLGTWYASKQGITKRLARRGLFEDRSRREDFKPFKELLAQLERTHPRSPWETPMAYIQRLVSTVSPEYAALLPLASRYYDARFGDFWWTEEERRLVKNMSQKVQEWKR